VSLAFACNRTWVRTIRGPSDDCWHLQRGVQGSQERPVRRGFRRCQHEQAFPRYRVVNDYRHCRLPDSGHVAVAALTVAAPRTPRSASKTSFPGLRCGRSHAPLVLRARS
jgi:hypothetical protein